MPDSYGGEKRRSGRRMVGLFLLLSSLVIEPSSQSTTLAEIHDIKQVNSNHDERPEARVTRQTTKPSKQPPRIPTPSMPSISNRSPEDKKVAPPKASYQPEQTNKPGIKLTPTPEHQQKPTQPSGYGCEAALAYLAIHAAPGFTFACPGDAFGHQAMTCWNTPPYCALGEKVIAIAVPCQVAYMNEANNSWVITGQRQGVIDPYGWC